MEIYRIIGIHSNPGSASVEYGFYTSKVRARIAMFKIITEHNSFAMHPDNYDIYGQPMFDIFHKQADGSWAHSAYRYYIDTVTVL